MNFFGPNFDPLLAQAKLANFGSILLCDTANMGFFWVGNSFLTLWDHLGHVLYPYPCPKWLNFCPIPAQSKLANFGSIFLCDTANMGF